MVRLRAALARPWRCCGQRKSPVIKFDEKGNIAANRFGPRSVRPIELGRLYHRLAIVALCAAHVVLLCLEIDLGVGLWRDICGTINSFILMFYIGDVVFTAVAQGKENIFTRRSVTDVAILAVALFERMTFDRIFVMQAIATLHALRHFEHLPETLAYIVSLEYRVCKTLIYGLLVVSLLVWSLAVACRHVLGLSPIWNGTMDPIAEGLVHTPAKEIPFDAFDNRLYFGSTAGSFVSLMHFVTRSNWADMGRRIVKKYPNSSAFFGFLIFTVSYGLLTSIVGTMFEKMLRHHEAALALRRDVDQQTQTKEGKRLVQLMLSIDENNDGQLSAEEIQRALDKLPEAKILMEKLGFPADLLDADNIIACLDWSGDSLISYDEFLNGFTTFASNISQYDYFIMQLRVLNSTLRASHFEKRCARVLEHVSEIRDKLAAVFNIMEHWHESEENSRIIRMIKQRVREAPPNEAPQLAGIVPFPEPTGFAALPRGQTDEAVGMIKRYLEPNRPPPPELLRARALVPAAAPSESERPEPPNLAAPPPLAEPRPSPPVHAPLTLASQRDLAERNEGGADEMERRRIQRARQGLKDLRVSEEPRNKERHEEYKSAHRLMNFRESHRAAYDELERRDLPIPGNPGCPDQWWKPPEERGRANKEWWKSKAGRNSNLLS